MRPILISIISMFVFIFTIGAYAQDNLRNHPGFIDLSNIEIPESVENVTEVSIGPEIFQMLAGMGNNCEGDIPKMELYKSLRDIERFFMNDIINDLEVYKKAEWG